MATKLIISYDGTNNEDDAIALGQMLVSAGAEAVLAYVRHGKEAEPEREVLVQHEAESLLERGAELFGSSELARHVVEDRSTPEGLRALAGRIDADAVVFCSDSHTASGHVSIGNSAQRLLEGGPVALAIAPAGLAGAEASLSRVAAVGDGSDPSATATARALADSVGGEVLGAAGEGLDLLVVGSRPEAPTGHVALSAAAERVVEEANCPVLVIPRGVALTFARQAAVAT